MLTSVRKILLFASIFVMLFSIFPSVMVEPGGHFQNSGSAKTTGTGAQGSGIKENVYTPIIGKPGKLTSTLFVGNNTLLPGSHSVPSGTGAAGPVASVYDPANGYIYVLNYQAGNVSIVNTATNSLVGSVPGIGSPVSGVYDPVNGYIYVAGSGGVSVINPATSGIVRTIVCGSINAYTGNGNSLTTLSYDSLNNTVFVANENSHNVSVISGSTNAVVETFNFSNASAEPDALAYDPSNNIVYIIDYSLRLVYIYDASTYRQVTNVTLPSSTDGGSIFYDPASNSILIGSQNYIRLFVLNTSTDSFSYVLTSGTPYAMQYDPVNATMLVAIYSTGTIQVLNSTDEITGNISVGYTGESFTFTGSSEQYLYMDQNTYNAVSVYNASTGSPVGEIVFTAQPSSEAYDPVTGNIYVTDYSSNAVYVVNATTNRSVKTVSLPAHANAIMYDPGNGIVYAAGNYMTGIDPTTNTVVSSVYFPRLPGISALAYDPNTGYIYTANHANFSVSAFDPNTGTVPFTYHMSYNSYPSTVVYDPADGYIYTDGFTDNTIYVLNASNLALVTTIYLGTGYYPAYAAYDPANEEVYFCSEASGSLAVVSDTYLANVITSVSGTTIAAYNPASKLMYVSSNLLYNGNATLYAINAYSNTIDATLQTGNFLGGMVYAPASKTLYATDQAGEGIYLFDGFAPNNYTVYFNETGLPAGTQWYVNLSTRASLSGTGTSLPAELPNGTFYYTVASSNRNYGATGGSVTVSGSSITVSVPFSSAKYTVTFSETGLPKGTKWWANVTGYAAASSTTGNITISLVNGTYSYNISTDNKTLKASVSSGTFSVDNSGTTVNVTFAGVTYSVVFSLLGLPYGDLAYVNLSNGMSANSTTLSIGFNLQNGTYSYTMGTPDKSYHAAGGTFTVSGAALGLAVFFNAVDFDVNFTETGLTPGAAWYVNISGLTGSGPLYTSVYRISVTNGSYTYYISSTNKSMNSPSGTFTVNGKSRNISVTFAAAYLVSFSESGLPSGTQWFVNLSNGMNLTTAFSFMYADLPAGSYSYTVQAVNRSWFATQATGSFTVVNNSVSVNITFARAAYTVSFAETNASFHSTWFVNITGRPSVSGTGPVTLNFYLPNGTYSYTVATSNSSWRVSPPSGTFKVSGASKTINVSFEVPGYSVSFIESGLPSGTQWFVNLSNDQKLASSSSDIAVSLPNGSYSYTVATTDKELHSSGGTFTVSGSSYTISVTFKPVIFNVSFSETGLPSADTWSVVISVNSVNLSLNPSTENAGLENGTYTYEVHSSSSTYHATGGTFTVDGSNVNISVSFSEVTYDFTFKENGLPPGTLWSVTFNGTLKTSTSSNITFVVSNGSYSYSLEQIKGYYFTGQQNGKWYVSGAPGAFDIYYHAYSYVTGTVTPANATITVNGITQPLTTGSFNMTVKNGTIHLMVTDKGYRTYYDNFTIGSGQVKNLTINLQSIAVHPSPVTNSGSGLPWTYIIVPLVVIIAIAVAAAAMRKRKS